MSATATATIRDDVPEDAVVACHVLRESISRLCETAHRFYQEAGYRDDGASTGEFGTSSGYRMSKEIVASW